MPHWLDVLLADKIQKIQSEETITHVTPYGYNLPVLSALHSRVMSWPKPNKDLSIRSNGRKIINIELQINPTSALVIISVGDPPVEVIFHIGSRVNLDAHQV